MKFCFKCKTNKTLIEFFNDKSRLDGKYPTCKSCIKQYQNTENFRQQNRTACSKWGKSEKGKISKQKYKKSKKGKQAQSKYQKINRGIVNARTAKYRAKKLDATPSWLSVEQIKKIKQFYVNCPKGYEVDHIIPLQGEDVCGLHVPWNLQLLSVSENRSKSNKLKGM